MGQTLTHGVYLPDEGERNCYAGLAANWQILDTSVGTIAAHTAALAGKAPAVHTHTKSDITDFPVYGTTAGTICEGNDSRLSDARTPVAHTHTKSDVTDLFNSANYWTENNTYAKYILMKNTTVEVGNAPSNNTSKEISFTDKNNGTLSRLVGKAETSGNSYIFLHATNKYANGALDPNGSARHSYFYVGLDATGKAYNKHAANTFPDANNAYDLGTSTNKWKTLNGINPGALSLPDCQVTQSIDRTGWVYDGATYNTVLLATTDTNMTKNGWLYVRMANTTSSDKLTIKYNSTADRYPTNTFGDAGGCIEAFVPVVAGTNIYVLATKDLSFCKFYPCLGNVPSGV